MCIFDMRSFLTSQRQILGGRAYVYTYTHVATYMYMFVYLFFFTQGFLILNALG